MISLAHDDKFSVEWKLLVLFEFCSLTCGCICVHILVFKRVNVAGASLDICFRIN